METGFIILILFSVVSFYLVYQSLKTMQKNTLSDEDKSRVINLFKIPSTHIRLLNNFYKKMVALIIYSVALGLITGIILNALWYIFCALILGWGDSAPDWYFNIQRAVHNSILAFPIFIWAVILWPKKE